MANGTNSGSDPFSRIITGVSQGQQLVSQALQNEFRREQLQQKQKEFQLKQNDFVIQNALKMFQLPPKFRRKAFENFQNQMRQASIPINPAIGELFTDEEYANTSLIPALTGSAELPDDERRGLELISALSSSPAELTDSVGKLQSYTTQRKKAIQEQEIETEKRVDALRKEFNNRQNVKDTRQAALGFAKVRAAVESDSPAGTVALIFGFMKTIDPTSVVRESEQDLLKKIDTIPQRFRQSIQSALISGQPLSKEKRLEILNAAQDQFLAQVDLVDRTEVKEFQNLASQRGLEADSVVAGFKQSLLAANDFENLEGSQESMAKKPPANRKLSKDEQKNRSAIKIQQIEETLARPEIAESPDPMVQRRVQKLRSQLESSKTLKPQEFPEVPAQPKEESEPSNGPAE